MKIYTRFYWLRLVKFMELNVSEFRLLNFNLITVIERYNKQNLSVVTLPSANLQELKSNENFLPVEYF